MRAVYSHNHCSSATMQGNHSVVKTTNFLQWHACMTYSRYTRNCQVLHEMSYIQLAGIAIHKTVKMSYTCRTYTQNCLVLKCHTQV